MRPEIQSLIGPNEMVVRSGDAWPRSCIEFENRHATPEMEARGGESGVSMISLFFFFLFWLLSVIVWSFTFVGVERRLPLQASTVASRYLVRTYDSGHIAARFSGVPVHCTRQTVLNSLLKRIQVLLGCAWIPYLGDCSGTKIAKA
jgi:hypothetical protein